VIAYGVLQIVGIVVVVLGLLLIFTGIFEKPELRERRYEPWEPELADYSAYKDELEPPAKFRPEYVSDRSKSEEDKRVKTEFGGVVMIGPIPLVFGNNTRAATVAIVLTMLLMLLTFLLFFSPRL